MNTASNTPSIMALKPPANGFSHPTLNEIEPGTWPPATLPNATAANTSSMMSS
jgi:hypothetical protein